MKSEEEEDYIRSLLSLFYVTESLFVRKDDILKLIFNL